MWLADFRHDLVFAARMLRKAPGFTFVVVVTLALGIGANTAIFSFFYGVLLRPLPLHEPDRVVYFQQARGSTAHIKADVVGLTTADYVDLNKNNRSLIDAATYMLNAMSLTSIEQPDLVNCAVLTPNFFEVLGARALLGRTFTAEDARGGGRFAVITHGYWQSTFGGDPALIGRPITVNGVNFTVLGVMPPDYDFPGIARIYLSATGPVPERMIGRANANPNGRGVGIRSIVGRLRPGVTVAQAEAELGELVRGLPNPGNLNRSVFLVTLREQIVGNIRTSLYVLTGCVVLVLLLACLNIGNLVLARANARHRETGIRLALGAGRGRIIRQLLAENLLLALLGGAAGVIVAKLGLQLLVQLAPADLPRLAAVHLDGWVLGFAFGLSVLTGLGVGLVPALNLAAVDLNHTLNEGTRGGSGGVERRRLSSILVAGEVAIALVLLVGAGLLLRSFWQMQAVSWGFDSAHVVTIRVGLIGRASKPAENYPKLLEQLEAEPGFEAVATDYSRIGVTWWPGVFAPDSQVYSNPTQRPRGNLHSINPAYFQALRIPLLRGRAFTRDDRESTQPVVIVDAAFARTYYPQGNALGHRVDTGRPDGKPAEIVGIVGDVKTDGPEAAPVPDLYLPYSQLGGSSTFVSVRTRLTTVAVTAAVRRIVRSIDASLPLTDMAAMDEVIERAGTGRRFPLAVIGAFAALALTLAAIGIYAVTSYAVARRTREIGIRMALGAQASEAIALILRQGARPVAIGLVVGVGGGTVLALAMRRLLFGIAPFDAATFSVVAVVLAAIATVACWLPARRAARVDPIIALRTE